MFNYRVCIYGGGNLGHVVAGMLANKGVFVNILTSNPDKWSDKIKIIDCNDKIFEGKIGVITNDPSLALKKCDLLLLCLPGHLIKDALLGIRKYIDNSIIVGSVVGSSGFFWIAKDLLPSNSKLFAFQRVPYISRIIEYGKSAELKGYKKEIIIGVSKNIDRIFFSDLLIQLFDSPIKIVDNYLEIALTNSNPILHPSRIYSEFYDKEKVNNVPLFYEDWNDRSSKVLIDADNEFQTIIKKIPMKNGLFIPSILEYYESKNKSELTNKIRSIKAFHGIAFPMIRVEDYYVLDFSNRYFIEDIPFGLIIIKSISELLKVNTPTIDNIIEWSQIKMGKKYLINGKLSGHDIKNTAAIGNYNINDIEQLINI